MFDKKAIILRASFAVFALSMTMMICSCGRNSEEKAVETEMEDDVVEQISDEQGVEAIRNYCCTINPDLESIKTEGFPVYWEIISSDNREIVVLFRSYTGAQVRYYIDRATGITTITEFVPGIMDEEKSTGESINVRDYIN